MGRRYRAQTELFVADSGGCSPTSPSAACDQGLVHTRCHDGTTTLYTRGVKPHLRRCISEYAEAPDLGSEAVATRQLISKGFKAWKAGVIL